MNVALARAMSPIRPFDRLQVGARTAALTRLRDGSVLISAGKAEVLAVPHGSDAAHDFFEPNHERYQRGDRVALGRGWRRLEIGSQLQFELSQAFLKTHRG